MQLSLLLLAAEVLAHILPPRIALPPGALAGWRIVNFVGAASVLVVLLPTVVIYGAWAGIALMSKAA